MHAPPRSRPVRRCPGAAMTHAAAPQAIADVNAFLVSDAATL
jgi:hypothetical protein